MKYFTNLWTPIQFLDSIFFRKIILIKVTGRKGNSRLGRRFGFDLKECVFDTKLKKSKEGNDKLYIVFLFIFLSSNETIFFVCFSVDNNSIISLVFCWSLCQKTREIMRKWWTQTLRFFVHRSYWIPIWTKYSRDDA